MQNKGLSKMIVINKSDLLSDCDLLKSMYTQEHACLISCKTKEGVEAFVQKLKLNVEKICTRDEGKGR